jgi:signal transduction histidine kinase
VHLGERAETISTDPGKLRQILINLLSNAVSSRSMVALTLT